MKTTPNKTQPTDGSVDEFLESIAAQGRRADAQELNRLLRDVTGVEPAMWGVALQARNNAG